MPTPTCADVSVCGQRSAPPPRSIRWLGAAALLALLSARDATACIGDCDASGAVEVGDLVRCVGIAGGDAAARCDACDADGDGAIAIDELVAAADRALRGCAPPTPTPTATALSTRPSRGTPGRVTATQTPRPGDCRSADGLPCIVRAPATVGPCGAVPLVGTQVSGSTLGGTNVLGNTEELNCGNNGGGKGAFERVYIFTPPAPGEYEITVQGDKFRPLLHLRKQSCEGEFMACAVDPTTNRRPRLNVSVTAPVQPIAICIDGDGSGQKGSFTLTVAARLPDLRVSSLTVAPQAVVGAPVAVELEVENVGDLAASSFAVEIQYFRDGALTQPLGSGPLSCRIAGLAPGAKAPCVLDVTLMAPFVAAGPYVVGVTVDKQREVPEHGDAVDGTNGANNRTSAPTEIVVPGAVLDQQLFRALDGTLYQLVRVLPSADPTAAEHYRITSLGVGTKSDDPRTCSTSDGFPGGTARAFAAFGNGSEPSLRTAVLAPGDVALSFDDSGAGRLTLGAGASNIDVCAGCMLAGAAPLTGLYQGSGGMPPGCRAFPITNFCPVGGATGTTGFGSALSPNSVICQNGSALTALTQICGQEPADGFVLQPGQSVVFVLQLGDNNDRHRALSAAIGGFAITEDGQNDSGCKSGQIVEAVAIQSDTDRQATLSFVEAHTAPDGLAGAAASAFNGSGSFLYVGSKQAGGALTLFLRDPATGHLTQQDVRHDGPVSAIVTAADINDVYALVGDTIRRYRVSFDFNTNTWKLAFQDATMLGSQGVDMALKGTLSARLYALTATSVKAYARDTQSGVLSLLQTLSESAPGVPLTSTALAAIAINRQSFAFVAHQPKLVSGNDYEMPITKLNLLDDTITPADIVTSAPGGLGPETKVGNSAIVVEPFDDRIYVARGSADSGAVDVYLTLSPTYDLTLQEIHRTGVDGAAGFKGASSLALYIRTRNFLNNQFPYLFVAGGDPAGTGASGDDAVTVFSRTANGSAFSLFERQTDGLGIIEGLDGPSTMVVSPDGKHLYVVTEVDDSVVLFNIND